MLYWCANSKAVTPVIFYPNKGQINMTTTTTIQKTRFVVQIEWLMLDEQMFYEYGAVNLEVVSRINGIWTINLEFEHYDCLINFMTSKFGVPVEDIEYYMVP